MAIISQPTETQERWASDGVVIFDAADRYERAVAQLMGPPARRAKNSKLILAVHDLLNAAQDAGAVLDALIEAMPERFSPDLLRQLEFTRDTCRAAVAKATGEAT